MDFKDVIWVCQRQDEVQGAALNMAVEVRIPWKATDGWLLKEDRSIESRVYSEDRRTLTRTNTEINARFLLSSISIFVIFSIYSGGSVLLWFAVFFLYFWFSSAILWACMFFFSLFCISELLTEFYDCFSFPVRFNYILHPFALLCECACCFILPFLCIPVL